MRAARTVFAISMAIVSKPTPPGTGVYAPAISKAFGSMSPDNRRSALGKCRFALLVALEKSVELFARGEPVDAHIDQASRPA
jgi:hypothetical protein